MAERCQCGHARGWKVDVALAPGPLADADSFTVSVARLPRRSTSRQSSSMASDDRAPVRNRNGKSGLRWSAVASTKVRASCGTKELGLRLADLGRLEEDRRTPIELGRVTEDRPQRREHMAHLRRVPGLRRQNRRISLQKRFLPNRRKRSVLQDVEQLADVSGLNGPRWKLAEVTLYCLGESALGRAANVTTDAVRCRGRSFASRTSRQSASSLARRTCSAMPASAVPRSRRRAARGWCRGSRVGPCPGG